MTTPLHDLIATYITTQDAPVSLTTIYTRAQGRFTDDAVRKAMSVIHKTRRDIKVTDDGREQWYSVRVLKPRTTVTPLKYRPTPEQQKEWRAVTEDFMQNSCLLSDEERACLAVPRCDRSDECHRLIDTSAQFQRTMERKYGAEKWKRMEADRATMV